MEESHYLVKLSTLKSDFQLSFHLLFTAAAIQGSYKLATSYQV